MPEGALQPITAFLASIGLPAQERRLAHPTLLPGVTIDRGTLVYDPALLEWPGDLLHEAGHIAVAPAKLRPLLNDTIGPDLLPPDAGEPEATAWAFAAITAIGLRPAVLFHSAGYQGKGEGLIRTYSLGVYPGLAGLASAGMAMGPLQARASGVAPYPSMIRWLRD